MSVVCSLESGIIDFIFSTDRKKGKSAHVYYPDFSLTCICQSLSVNLHRNSVDNISQTPSLAFALRDLKLNTVYSRCANKKEAILSAIMNVRSIKVLFVLRHLSDILVFNSVWLQNLPAYRRTDSALTTSVLQSESAPSSVVKEQEETIAVLLDLLLVVDGIGMQFDLDLIGKVSSTLSTVAVRYGSDVNETKEKRFYGGFSISKCLSVSRGSLTGEITADELIFDSDVVQGDPVASRHVLKQVKLGF